MLLNWPPGWEVLLYVPALLVGFTVHELAHALLAFLLGDTSQVERNRLTFNPLRHVSWWGGLIFLLSGWFIWAKPLVVNPSRFRLKHPALGVFLVSIAGVIANALTAIVTLMGLSASLGLVWLLTGAPLDQLLQFMSEPQPGDSVQMLVVALGWYVVLVNGWLALWNSLPLPPFDGFHALVGLFDLVRNALKKPARTQVAGSPPPAVEATADVNAEAPSPSPAQIHFDIGLEYQQAGQVDEAIARYRQAIAHDEQFALAYYNLGLAYLAKERPSLAAGAFRSALHFGRDVRLHLEADARLREVARAEQDGVVTWDAVPPPLEPDSTAGPILGQVTSALNPDLVRRVWLRLAIGGIGASVLALSTWVLVTLLMLLSFMQTLS
jgi:Zn-dependent protease